MSQFCLQKLGRFLSNHALSLDPMSDRSIDSIVPSGHVISRAWKIPVAGLILALKKSKERIREEPWLQMRSQYIMEKRDKYITNEWSTKSFQSYSLGSNLRTIVTVPPPIILRIPRRKGDAGKGTAGLAGIGDTVSFQENDSCRHNTRNRDYQAKEAGKDVFEGAPTSFFFNSEEGMAHSLHCGHATKETEKHSAHMSEVIYERSYSLNSRRNRTTHNRR